MGESSKSGGSRDSGSTLIVLPGQKLATSKKPRALTRSEIELLRQDLRAALSVVGRDEIDDARTLIRAGGLRDSDFEIFQRSDSSPAYIGDVTGTVTVMRTSNSVAKTYETGSRSSWLLDLERDLKSDAFGGDG